MIVTPMNGASSRRKSSELAGDGVGTNDAKSEWLRQLLVGHEGRLLRYVRRKVSDEAARDVVQEAFLRLWKEDPTKLKGRETEWLFCVCRNLALDALKKEAPMRKGAKASLPEALEKLESAEENADAKLERQGEENAVNRIIDSLPDAQQEVVRLKFQEGFSYKEISSITGHSVSYVGVLIHEAMTRLRGELAPGMALRQGGGR